MTIANYVETDADTDTTDGTSINAGASAAGAATGGPAKTVDMLVASINDDLSLKGKVKASNDGGKLRIENLSTGTLTLTGASATDGEIDGTAGTKTIDGNDVRKALIGQFNELRKQLDKLAGDASYNGVNLLKADKLKITFNETGTSTIDVQAKNVGRDRARHLAPRSTSLDIGAAHREPSSRTTPSSTPGSRSSPPLSPPCRRNRRSSARRSPRCRTARTSPRR